MITTVYIYIYIHVYLFIQILFSVVSPDKLIVFFGDKDGCINIFIIFPAREILRILTTFERRKGIPTISFDRFLTLFKRCDYVRWEVHKECIGNEII